jgi:hypothetical protein
MKHFPLWGGLLEKVLMSATLFALVVLHGSSLTFSPGYQSAQECQAVYQGPNVTCYAYDPSGTTWTAFFRLPDGEFKAFGRMRDEAECKRTLSSLMAGIPSACRQLGMVVPSPCGLSTCPAAPQRRLHQPQFDPFSALVSLFTPREY